ncbi:DEAD/DEAH box helicase [Succinivibrio sp.]|uniref:DEAD/DEAH box helicase n=1 Tax=Succinivibrio sp. TaxID=2053619 RepID=UPI0025D57151|nr:helicase-related protein [Succinivibrio sp.]MBQ9220456.1 DEAD/DEAH box helicase family protein [Succinivibrio sp.]
MVDQENNTKMKMVENQIISSLKNFQIATVERLVSQFKAGARKLLVADEVGLGKTIVARGIIAKLSEEYENKDRFRVVYVCSNQILAKQNIKKLNIFDEDISEIDSTRLSMQHFQIALKNLEKKKIQLLTITPSTSLTIYGKGNYQERALILSILAIINDKLSSELNNEINDYNNKDVTKILDYFRGKVNINEFVKKVQDNLTEIANNKEYQSSIKEEFSDKIKLFEDLSEEKIFQYIDELKSDKQPPKDFLEKLRRIFSAISIDTLEPDLIIFDEFQRTKELLENSEQDNELQTLTQKFLNASEKTRVLLLSATPYKPFSTSAEIRFTKRDDHFNEFKKLIKFLIPDNQEYSEFEVAWKEYTELIKRYAQNEVTEETVYNAKSKAEDQIFKVISRTERNSVIEETAGLIEESENSLIKINREDIKSYVETTNFLNLLPSHINKKIPIDYIKSCPYLMSFLNGYKVKNWIKKGLSELEKNGNQQAREEIIKFLRSPKKSSTLYLERRQINSYKDVKITNARLNFLLKEIGLKKESNANKSKPWLYLWVAPTKAYYPYPEDSPYLTSDNFSKTLIFSSWDMVPKMLSTLVSYEVEKLSRSSSTQYFTKHSEGHLKLRKHYSKVKGLSVFNLIYPSKYLAELFHPAEFLKENIKDKKQEIIDKIKGKLDQLYKKLEENNIHLSFAKEGDILKSTTWYYLAPILIDSYLDKSIDIKWWKNLKCYFNKTNNGGNNKSEVPLQKGIEEIINILDYINKTNNNTPLQNLPDLGKIPKDLPEMIYLQLIASPAICLKRIFGSGYDDKVVDLAISFTNKFNQFLSVEIINKVTKNKKNLNNYWKRVLYYCYLGNFQAMIDEYSFVLRKANAYLSESKLYDMLFTEIKQGISYNVTTYDVDFSKFNIINNNDKQNKKVDTELENKNYMRASYATCFAKGKNEDKETKRQEKLLKTFNSPFWPFVLSTTSVGQEGLDFHYYCRRVVHWNLPSNPIDMEQREGRVNRYMNLALRQSVVQELNNKIDFCEQDLVKGKVLDVLFEKMEKEKEENGSDGSQLEPYWCLNNQKVKIRRVVLQYPYSIDIKKYNNILKILAYYRITLGQPRQEEFLNYVLSNISDSKKKKIKELFINLEPFLHQNRKD